MDALAEEGMIFKLSHPEKKATILYPRHRLCAPSSLPRFRRVLR